MLETFATGLAAAIGFYLLVGLVFAVWFVGRGVNRVDPLAREGTRGFRVLILPGAAALWPLLVRRLLAGGSPRERTMHRDLAVASPEAPSADREPRGEGG